MKILFVFILCSLLLFGCKNSDNQEIVKSDEKDSAVVEDMHDIPIPEEPEVIEPVTVSPVAQEDFLEPIEDFSWEREYPAEFVVLHFTSAVMSDRENPYDVDTVRQIFVDNELSIHYIIDRDGSVRCYMPEDRVAWHAGKGSWKDDERLINAMNKYSIGIEILAIGSEKDMSQYLTPSEYATLDKSLVGFTDEQYESLKTLLSDVCTRNSIPLDRDHVIGHEEYNPSKSDPGELFDWNKIFE